jgi:hypothetical protein
LFVRGTKDGDFFLLGDWINAYIFPETEGKFALWRFAAAPALNAGAALEALPDFREIASYVAASMGGMAFGAVRAPLQHRREFKPLNALRLFWPAIQKIFAMPVFHEGKPVEEPALSPADWPIVLSVVAGQIINSLRDQIKPELAMAMVLESAAIASATLPDKVVAPEWKIEVRAGKLLVNQLPPPAPVEQPGVELSVEESNEQVEPAEAAEHVDAIEVTEAADTAEKVEEQETI